MIKGDMCLKIIEKGKPKDVIIKEGEVMWIPSMVCGVLSGTQLEHTSAGWRVTKTNHFLYAEEFVTMKRCIKWNQFEFVQLAAYQGCH